MEKSREELLKQYGCGPIPFSEKDHGLYERHLIFDKILDAKSATERDQFEAVARSIRDVLSQRWLLTDSTYEQKNPKRIYYLSIEFLIGRSLNNNITNLLLTPVTEQVVTEKQIDWLKLTEEEPDAGLGNGGLGRLAACFLDSMATLQLPAIGYGLRYEYGMFKQTIKDGWQQEQPDNWLRQPDPWEVLSLEDKVEIKLNCTFGLQQGKLKATAGTPSTLLGIPYDRPIVGYGGETINTLRLWAAASSDEFDFSRFSQGDMIGALAETLIAETITRVLYPDDSTAIGQALRFVQEYFFVACSLADLIRRFRKSNADWHALPEKVAIQMNDTHPAIAVAELMRILLDEAHLDWDLAWKLTQETLAYTNHTLLPEALEKWPVEWFELLQPRLLQIIYEINYRFLQSVKIKYPADDARLSRISLIEEGHTRKVRMAHLAIVGSHSTNGVAALHSKLLRTTTVKDMAEIFPKRFNNKTNGVTPRRWLHLANPSLASVITEAIGDSWIKDLSQLNKLKPMAKDRSLGKAILSAKHQAKVAFANWIASRTQEVVNPHSIFDCQVKRIHEYKRQLLNTLRILVLYNRLKANPDLNVTPRTFFFAGKAAPAYHMAKLIIKFINNLARTINGDKAVSDKLKVVFLPDYCVSLAERLIPASDVSNQISTAGYEASGTSNMKFMMNGALTIGTRDGATIEIAEAAGEENLFLFGLTAEEVKNSAGWYNPRWHYDHERETREAIDTILSNGLSRYEKDVFLPLCNMLMATGEKYRHLADLGSYLTADQKLCDLYLTPNLWAEKVIVNLAASGTFSSDRTIAEYASDIWKATPCPIP